MSRRKTVVVSEKARLLDVVNFYGSNEFGTFHGIYPSDSGVFGFWKFSRKNGLRISSYEGHVTIIGRSQNK